jgi:hypothetical protein
VTVVHDFAERLAFSQSASEEPAWVDFYRRLWPDFIAAVRIDKDCPQQRWGVDRAIFLASGRQVTVDEKVRHFRNGRPFDDFLIEVWSNAERRKVGWTLDPEKRCDFIAYAVPALGKCYLLPFELLRLTCAGNIEKWKRASRPPYPICAHNKGWTTHNCSVPWPALFAAMREEMTCRFGAAGLTLPVPKVDQGDSLFEWAAKPPPAPAAPAAPPPEDDDIPF